MTFCYVVNFIGNLIGDDPSHSAEEFISLLLECSSSILKDKIIRAHSIINEFINLDCLEPFLDKYRIFTSSEKEYLYNKYIVKAEKVSYLIKCLEAKNEKGIHDFVRALDEAYEHSGHIDILKHLHKPITNE